ncbi:PspC domain-containing protein [Streptomyces sp. NPDC002553]|uniref:PspC domain-containing protein n=1 Tax=Streptomyces sp. NPDC002553 TaxID=3154417 RepID=UPI0033178A5A
MTDHQHAADAGPDRGAAPDAATPSTGAPGAAGEEPRAHEQAAAPEQPDARAGTGEGTGPRTSGDRGGPGDPGDGPGDRGRPSGVHGPPDAPDPVGRLPHRFRRDREHKLLAGVCAGLGRQCDMDPVIFRITLAVLSATGGIGLIFYGFAWLFVPYAGDDQNEVRKLLTGRVDGQALAALLFALVGCGVFLSMLNNGGVLSFAALLSLLLAGAAYWSQHRDASDTDPLAAQAVADAPPEAKAPPAPAAYSSWWRDPIVKDGTHEGGTGYLWGPRDPRTPDATSVFDVELAGHKIPYTSIRPPAPAPRPRGPRRIGGWLFLLAALAGGLVTRLTWDQHPLGTSLQAGLATGLVILGVGIAVSSYLGRTGAGSVFLAVIVAGLLAGAAVLPKDIGTRWTHTTWRPAAVTEVRADYDVDTGDAVLDLSRLDLAKGQTLRTGAELGAGRLKVIVPPEVTVRLSIEVGLGDIQLPGEDEKDVDVQPGRHKQMTLSPASGGQDAGTIDLDLQVAVGQAEVARAAS